MESLGANKPCDSWILPKSTFVRNIKLGYDSQGVTYIKAVTNNAIEFTRGVLKPTDSVTFQDFTEQNPLVGLQGYESKNSIKALGFVRFNCTQGPPPTPLETSFSVATHSETIFTLPTMIAVSVAFLLAGLVLGCGSFALGSSLRGRFGRKRPKIEVLPLD